MPSFEPSWVNACACKGVASRANGEAAVFLVHAHIAHIHHLIGVIGGAALKQARHVAQGKCRGAAQAILRGHSHHDDSPEKGLKRKSSSAKRKRARSHDAGSPKVRKPALIAGAEVLRRDRTLTPAVRTNIRLNIKLGQVHKHHSVVFHGNTSQKRKQPAKGGQGTTRSQRTRQQSKMNGFRKRTTNYSKAGPSSVTDESQ
ncbi:MAG: hypothetical protein M5U25_16245 [Planctomycetota bacterium]|nr:hypothetical protein [Planctomycetota bacterium]